MTTYFIFIIITIIISLFLLLSKIYIKLKFGFWSIQPVFHIYDFQYFLFPKGIIMHSLPEKNKYTNFKNIETILFSKISTLQKTKFIQFIKINYLRNKGNIFKPEEKNIIDSKFKIQKNVEEILCTMYYVMYYVLCFIVLFNI